MSRQSSNINSSIRGGRRREHFKRFGMWLILILLVISLSILGLTWQGVRVHAVNVYGNESVSSSQIQNIIDQKLDEKYAFIIPTDNFLLLKRSAIENQILHDVKKIDSVSVSFNGLNDVEVYVSERVPQGFWCDDLPQTYTNCYFMDRNGFVFAHAPEISGNVFMKYFGLIGLNHATSTEKINPIGESYFNENTYRQISLLNQLLTQMKFNPIAFKAVDRHEYVVDLFLGGKIYLNDKKTFERDIIDLQALIDGGYVRTDIQFLQKLQYIDLRYGKKVIIK